MGASRLSCAESNEASAGRETRGRRRQEAGKEGAEASISMALLRAGRRTSGSLRSKQSAVHRQRSVIGQRRRRGVRRSRSSGGSSTARSRRLSSRGNRASGNRLRRRVGGHRGTVRRALLALLLAPQCFLLLVRLFARFCDSLLHVHHVCSTLEQHDRHLRVTLVRDHLRVECAQARQAPITTHQAGQYARQERGM